MVNEPLSEWIRNNVSPQFVTQYFLSIADAIDHVVINGINKLISELNYPYTIKYATKFIFIKNQLHILFRWFYSDLLLGDKNIGESVIIIDPVSFEYMTNGSLIVDVMETVFTSAHLVDFKSIIAHLTLKITKLVDKTFSFIGDAAPEVFPSQSKPHESVHSPVSVSERIAESEQISIPTFTLPVNTGTGQSQKAFGDKKHPSEKRFAVPSFSSQSLHQKSDMNESVVMNKMGNSDMTKIVGNNMEGSNNIVGIEGIDQGEILSGKPKTKTKELPDIPTIPKMNISSIRKRKT